MIRRAFVMRLKPEAIDQYRQHHEHIWPELVAEIERSGIASITTFQHGADLFFVSEVTDEDAWQRLWASQVHRRWTQLLEPLVQHADDGTVAAGELVEIAHISTNGAARAASSTVASNTGDEPAAILSMTDALAFARRNRAQGSRAKAPVAPTAETKHKMGASRSGTPAASASAGRKRTIRLPVKGRKRSVVAAATKKARQNTSQAKTTQAQSRKKKTAPRAKAAAKKTLPKRR